jgi:sulfur carrier protein ThiS
MKDFFIWVSILVQISVILPRTNHEKIIDIDDNTSIQDVLKKLSIKADTCLTLIDTSPVPLDTILQKDQKVTLIEVTSGG